MIHPRRLFIAADGPRSGSDSDFRNCAAARLITQKPAWSCDVKYRFLEKNYGCRRAVSGAVDWFFSQVDEGIILEDDCLPSADFFHFCSAALKQYRNDEKIMHINGTVHLPPESPDKKADDFIFDTVYRKSPLSKRVTAKLKKIF